jgi:hypothetical protein
MGGVNRKADSTMASSSIDPWSRRRATRPASTRAARKGGSAPRLGVDALVREHGGARV